MSKDKNKHKDNNVNQDKKTFHVVKKHDDTIEVAIRKNPTRTPLGKFVAMLVLVGFLVLPIVALVFAIISRS